LGLGETKEIIWGLGYPKPGYDEYVFVGFLDKKVSFG
jgi:hypothetical protein